MSFSQELILGRPLADGVLTNASAALYTVPTGFRAVIENITYFNTDAATRAAQMHIDDGTSRQMWQESIGTKKRSVIIDKQTPIYLDEGHIIKGHDDAGSVVNYFVYGRLEQKG
jgi:hypothetical protein